MTEPMSEERLTKIEEHATDPCVDELIAEVRRLSSDNARLREGLKKLEWADRICLGGGSSQYSLPGCPVCMGISSELKLKRSDGYAIGHAHDCWLAARIQEQP